MNVMTEDEAKGKWCPFARGSYYATTSVNRDQCGAAWGGAQCLANGCAAWRWAWSDDWREVEGSDGLASQRLPSSTHGYCGLAGSPTP